MNTEKIKYKNTVKRYVVPPTWEYFGGERYESKINISFTAKGNPWEVEELLSKILKMIAIGKEE